ncbi:MAG: DUF6321 domain-containing protein [Aquincola tertiaricarbonis]
MATKKTAAKKAPWDKGNPKARDGRPTQHLTPEQKAAAKRSAKKAGRPYPNLVDNMHAAADGKAPAKKAAAKKAAARKTAAKKAPAKKAVARKAPAKKAPAKKATASKTAAKKAPAKKTAAKKTPAKKTPARKTAARKAPAKKAAAKKAASKKPPAGRALTRDPAGGLTAAGRAEFARTQGAHLRPGVTKPESEMSPEDMKRKGSWAVRFYGRDPLPPLLDKQGRPTRLALSAHAWGEKVPSTEAQARRIADKGRRLLARYKRLQGG